MNPLIHLKTITSPLLITLALLCLGLLPQAQAVVPPPDGGYPGFNTAEGQNALFSLTTGAANTAVGWFSLQGVSEGSFNTATGAGALLFSTSDQNTAFGAAALLFNTFGFGNTAIGAAALLSNTGATVDTPNGGPGSANTAVGVSSLSSNTTGGFNTAVGAYALANSLGLGNIALGSGAGSNVTNANDVIAIGIAGANVDDSCYIGNIHGATIDPGTGIPVGVDATGKLGTILSSQRFKHDIKPMDKASEAILAFKPVMFHYNRDAKATPQYGLIAEEVTKVNPDLVVRDKSGEILTVRYDAVNAMLLNEFLKEHRKVEQLTKDFESKLAEQQKQIEALTTGLQKVSEQIQISRPAPQVAENNQ